MTPLVDRVTFGATEQIWLRMPGCVNVTIPTTVTEVTGPPNERQLTNVRQAATDYIAGGLQVVPLDEGTKACLEKDWLKLVFTPDDFRPTDNIGIRNVNGLVDIDCDAPEVVEMASDFLPSTGARYGRPSKPRAHWLYRSQFEKRIAFLDLSIDEEKKATLVEIRVNHQSMAPPSIHPDDKEVLGWDGGTMGEMADLPTNDLLRAVQLLATAGLVGRFYNAPGNRHDWCLALAGVFRKEMSISHEEANRILTAAARWARDMKLGDRLEEVKDTYEHGDDDPLKQAGDLKEAMPKGTVFLKSLRRIWGATSDAFVRDRNGERIISNDQDNIKRALTKLGATLTFNDFTKKHMLDWKLETYAGPLNDAICTTLWLTIDRKYRFRPQYDLFIKVIQDVANHHRCHPVLEYLASVESAWDRVSRLDTWLIRHAKAADTPYVRAISSIVLIAAVRRVRQPGCKYDEMVVLESAQGQLKSSALRVLCPDENWFSDDLPLNLDAKRIIEQTTGKWIIEAAELSGMSANMIEHLKSMLSRQSDGPTRLAYDRTSSEQPRQFIIVGTTNHNSYLQDQTGNRRFWPIRVEQFDLEALSGERDQLWAEAVHREKKGESIRLSPTLYDAAKLEQERRRVEEPWENTLRPYYGPPNIKDENPVAEYQRVHPLDVWDKLGVPPERRTKGHVQVINLIMQRWGYKKNPVKKAGKVDRGWCRGERVKQGELLEDDGD